MTEPGRVFVTGGTGFVGGRLIERLRREGHEVRVLARSEQGAARVSELGAEAVRGDLTSVGALAQGVEGCEWVFHVAANTQMWGPVEDYARDNVEGTRNVLAASEQAGVRRFVQVSSSSVYMRSKSNVNVDETGPVCTDSPVPYGSTKARAELLVLGANREGFETVAIRLHWIWGAGDTVILPRLVEAVQADAFPWYGGGRFLMSTAHVDNVVEALLLAATRGVPGNTYFISDGEPVVFRDFVSEQLKTRGVDPPTRSVSVPWTEVKAWAGELWWRKLNRPGVPPVTRFYFWVCSREQTVNDAKARRELGYRPVKSVSEGMAEMRAAA
jgi:nucleoside-diphosphate-sugar epimerase